MYINRKFPKWKYLEGEAPVIVANKDEEAALGIGWRDSPDGVEPSPTVIPSGSPAPIQILEYPKLKYTMGKDGPETFMVHDKAEEDKLGPEWIDGPDKSWPVPLAKPVAAGAKANEAAAVSAAKAAESATVKSPYPKTKYRGTESRVIANAFEENQLGSEWTDSPTP